MNYSEMSDFEINREVAEKVGGFLAKDIFEEEQTVFKWHPGNKYSKFDPCNSWADAGPIIQGNKITILHDEQLGWCAGVACWVDGYEFGFSKCEYAHPNPLRAVMCVFLMMQEKPNA